MLKNNGQALVEYILIILLITATVIGLVRYFGGYLKDYITKTSCELVEKEYVEGDSPGEGKCEYLLEE